MGLQWVGAKQKGTAVRQLDMRLTGSVLGEDQQYMGHSSTAVTEQTYARYASDHLADAADIPDFGELRVVQ